jgi:hypothetical protein
MAENGLVTGYTQDRETYNINAFRWSRNEGYEELPIPAGVPYEPGGYSLAANGVALNPAGRVVGSVSDAWDNFYPAEWTRTGASFLPQIGEALDVNARGQSVGYLFPDYAMNLAYTKTPKGEVVILAANAVATAINDRGDILGVIDPGGANQVVLWRVKP